ncbi:hypothetical protein E5P55_00495 [Candidatus Pinguicoccus supinus]|uniref:Uncharacterized protein n=1 Tax=Candidatus Pinguicoccus supinus TaxID=2529394 RepID=A0A7T0BRJ0_9BACT|nr:hypothetical protein E5P55_00495 [Candidatus Pinguicoccus supinus]
MLYIIKKNLNILRLNSKNVLNIDSFYFTPKNLIVKFGIDPTKPYLTVGHSIFLIRLNSLIFTDVKIILGVFTSVIGDPTGRSIERPIIKNKHALLNAEIYIKNLKTTLVNKKKFKIYVNLWFSKLKLSSFFKFIGDFNI